jgi:peptidoglycan LD-endopeptidase CwlK
MPREFSAASADRLATCHPDLQVVFQKVLYTYDCSILCGHRGPDEQHQAFVAGRSKLDWPKSKHNEEPSKAVDAAPYVNNRLNYDSIQCAHFAGYVQATAISLGISIRWGGDWNRNQYIGDNTFNDLVHFELVED